MNNLLGFTILVILVLASFGCNQEEAAPIQPLADTMSLESVMVGEIPVEKIGTGIAIGVGVNQVFEINIPMKDSELVKLGQRGSVSIVSLPSTSKGLVLGSVSARVVRMLMNASHETNQTIVWLKPEGKSDIPEGEFVQARIKTEIKRNALLLNKKALLVRDGGSFVIQKKQKDSESNQHTNLEVLPTQIQTGLETENQIEVTHGLNPSDSVVVQGGIGFLSPAFLQKGGD